MSLCGCGCSREVSKEGNKFVKGHNRKGIHPWNIGKQIGPYSEVHRNKIREKLKGKPKSEEHRKHLELSHEGQIPWNSGLSKEIQPTFGKHWNWMEESIEKISGENSYLWNYNREEVFSPYTELFYDLNYREQIKKEQNSLDPITEQVLTKRASLHHIDYDKQNDSRENLIWLNSPTHAKTNSHREEWKQLLQKINDELIKSNSSRK